MEPPTNSAIPAIAITTENWTLDSILQSSANFKPIARVEYDLAPPDLRAYITTAEGIGAPFVVEGCHKHKDWPNEMFTLEWLLANAPSQIMSARNIHDRTDREMTLRNFLDVITNTPPRIVPGETERLYGKDYVCPPEWNHWVEHSGVLPSHMLPNSDANILRNLPLQDTIETIMCYIGVGDTFTPCHKDLCGSSGQNLMCYTSDELSSSFWFMTTTQDAAKVVAYFQELNQELDLESHAITLEELQKAPFPVFITEQKLGDFVYVPPRSCHQVVNRGGITVKTSWSRMTLQGIISAFYHELPIYRRVCRPETYRVRSIVYHTMSQTVTRLETAQLRGSQPDLIAVLVESLENLIITFDKILAESFPADLLPTAQASIKQGERMAHVEHCTCDFCGADIFQSFFECGTCNTEDGNEAAGGILICTGCYVEGRTCLCGVMDPVQLRPFQSLLADRNHAARILARYKPGSWQPVEMGTFSNLGHLHVFQAALILRNRRLEGPKTHAKKTSRTCSNQRQGHYSSHEVDISGNLRCDRCHAARCFAHILDWHGVHAAEAILSHANDESHQHWHDRHNADKRKVWEAQKDECDKDEERGTHCRIEARKALAAIRHPNCRPIQSEWVSEGWYDGNCQGTREGLSPGRMTGAKRTLQHRKAPVRIRAKKPMLGSIERSAQPADKLALEPDSPTATKSDTSAPKAQRSQRPASVAPTIKVETPSVPLFQSDSESSTDTPHSTKPTSSRSAHTKMAKLQTTSLKRAVPARRASTRASQKRPRAESAAASDDEDESVNAPSPSQPTAKAPMPRLTFKKNRRTTDPSSTGSGEVDAVQPVDTDILCVESPSAGERPSEMLVDRSPGVLIPNENTNVNGSSQSQMHVTAPVLSAHRSPNNPADLLETIKQLIHDKMSNDRKLEGVNAECSQLRLDNMRVMLERDQARADLARARGELVRARERPAQEDMRQLRCDLQEMMADAVLRAVGMVLRDPSVSDQQSTSTNAQTGNDPMNISPLREMEMANQRPPHGEHVPYRHEVVPSARELEPGPSRSANHQQAHRYGDIKHEQDGGYWDASYNDARPTVRGPPPNSPSQQRRPYNRDTRNYPQRGRPYYNQPRPASHTGPVQEPIHQTPSVSMHEQHHAPNAYETYPHPGRYKDGPPPYLREETWEGHPADQQAYQSSAQPRRRLSRWDNDGAQVSRQPVPEDPYSDYGPGPEWQEHDRRDDQRMDNRFVPRMPNA